jgi:hypothetical protein
MYISAEGIEKRKEKYLDNKIKEKKEDRDETK